MVTRQRLFSLGTLTELRAGLETPGGRVNACPGRLESIPITASLAAALSDRLLSLSWSGWDVNPRPRANHRSAILAGVLPL